MDTIINSEITNNSFTKLTDEEVVGVMTAYIKNFGKFINHDGTIKYDYQTKYHDLWITLIKYVEKNMISKSHKLCATFGQQTYYYLDCEFNKRSLINRFKNPKDLI